jgi:group II intron reverse transcriptase/maturase
MTELVQAKTQPIEKRQVWNAWLHVRSGGKTAGVDGLSMDAIEADPGKYLYPLWNRLASGCYMPPPVKEKKIPKGDGKERTLGIPTILDRVAQQVIRAELEALVEPKFHPDSYGYRPGRSAHDALAQCAKRCQVWWFGIDLDIKAFFDTIDHGKMMSVLRKHTDKRHVLLYCERWLRAPMMKPDGTLEQRDRGTPQGGVISPLLANLYLHEVFDEWLSATAPDVGFERYADDIVVHTKSRAHSVDLLAQIKERLKEYSLELSEEKTKIVYCWKGTRPAEAGEDSSREFDFLGFTFKPRYLGRRGKMGGIWLFNAAISAKSEKRIGEALSDLRIHRWQSMSIEEVGRKLAPKLRGWIGYFSRYNGYLMNQLWWRLNVRLIKWARRKFKTATFKGAYDKIRRICRSKPQLFHHWSKGFTV